MHSLKLLIILYFFLYPFSPTHAKTSFIVVGHLYPVVHDEILMERLFNKFDSLNPDYIFILGDSLLHKKQIYSYFYNRFKGKIYFSPGNNEVINGSLSKYKENVGYTNNIIESNDANFILLNSSNKTVGSGRDSKSVFIFFTDIILKFKINYFLFYFPK